MAELCLTDNYKRCYLTFIGLGPGESWALSNINLNEAWFLSTDFFCPSNFFSLKSLKSSEKIRGPFRFVFPCPSEYFSIFQKNKKLFLSQFYNYHFLSNFTEVACRGADITCVFTIGKERFKFLFKSTVKPELTATFE